jgi:hypothetical protein
MLIHRVFYFIAAFLLISTPLLLSCGSDLNTNGNRSRKLSQKGLSAIDQNVTMDSQVTTPYPGETTESPLGLSVKDRITKYFNGTATLHVKSSDKYVAFNVRSDSGRRLSGKIILISDGHYFEALVLHRNAKYGLFLPVVVSGTLNDSLIEALLDMFGPKSAHAFEPHLTVNVVLPDGITDTVTYNNVYITDYFQTEELLSSAMQSTETICADQEMLKGNDRFTSGLAITKSGIIKKHGYLETWAAKQVPSSTVIDSVADALFSNYAQGTRYFIKAGSSSYGFTFHENTGIECV